ncbi:MAG: fibronectin type III domain-containing protein [Solirubrobacterales bacterium]|nr:fibronectin type III domain-containing protein [Solirubrobacterales bacterium]
MRRMRLAAAIVLVACGVLSLVITSASHPSSASAAASPPTAATGSPSNVTQSSATVNGTVNPNGQTTSYYFRYGTTTSYGLQTSPAGAGNGTGTVAVHATFFGLTENTTYHYQLVAHSAAGTTTGADQTLTTTSTPSQTVVLGHEGFVSPGLIVGAEVGCFHGSSPCNGHLTMSSDGTVIAQRDYSIDPDSGGFQNMQLNSIGQSRLSGNAVFHLLPVTVTATQTDGQTASWVIHLARWVWH